MASASWLGFCVSSPVTKTCIHFYPSSGSLGAPYQADCQLTVFGNNIGKRTISIDGLKLTQPDGIWIDDAFPHFTKSETNIAGLKIELKTHQPKTDLNNSWCVIELVSNGESTRFKAKNLQSDLESETNIGSGALLSDSNFSSSLIAINCDRETFTPSLQTIDHEVGQDTEKGERKNINVPSLAPMSVEEININGDFFSPGTSKDLSWGKSSISGIYVNPSLEQETAVFAVYREMQNKRPVSVLAL